MGLIPLSERRSIDLKINRDSKIRRTLSKRLNPPDRFLNWTLDLEAWHIHKNGLYGNKVSVIHTAEGMVEIIRTKKEIVHMKTTINPNDKKSNYFLNLQLELFPFSKSRTISALPQLKQ